MLQHLTAIDVLRRAIDPHSSQRFVFNMQRPAGQPNLRRPTRVVERSSLDRPEGQMPAEYDDGLGGPKRIRCHQESSKPAYQEGA